MDSPAPKLSLWRQRPFVPLALAYLVGVLLGQQWTVPILGLVVLAGVALVSIILVRSFRPYLVCALLTLAGWLNYLFQTQPLAANDLRHQFGHEAQLVTVRGTLTETPRLKIHENRGRETWRSVAPVQVREILRANTDVWQPASGTVLVTTPDVPPPEMFRGQNVEVSGALAPPAGPVAEGLFDFRAYLAQRGIDFELKTMSWSDWKLVPPTLSQPPWDERFLRWAKKTLALGLPVEDEPLRLLWAMTLDWRTAFTGDISDPFLQAGTMHMFAIDGLRIALLAGTVVTLLRALRLSRAWCGLVVIPLIWFYTAATGYPASAIRASVMMTLILVGWALRRPTDLLNSLAAAALLLLLWDPRQLAQAGFQLSFCVVLVIAVLLPPLNDWLDRRFQPDPLKVRPPPGRWKKCADWFTHRLGRLATVSFTAWVGSLPLGAKYFHLFNPVSTLANVVAVPLGTLALIANLGALLCGPWLTWATILFNHAAWACMDAMLRVSEWSARLPGAYWYVPEPSLAQILFYYALVLGALGGGLATTLRRCITISVWTLLAVVCLAEWWPTRVDLRLVVIPSASSPIIYTEGPAQPQHWLLNTGPADETENTLKPFLRAHGVNRLPPVIITDGSVNEAGGLTNLADAFVLDDLWTPGVSFRSAKYHDLVNDIEATHAQHHELTAGQTIGLWHCLHPPAHPGAARTGQDALVLLGEFYLTRILVLSDLNRAGQAELLNTQHDLHADLLITAVPDDNQPPSEPILQAVHPRLVIISEPPFGSRRRMKNSALNGLAENGVPFIDCHELGGVTIVVRPDGWEVRTMAGPSINSDGASNLPPHNGSEAE